MVLPHAYSYLTEQHVNARGVDIVVDTISFLKICRDILCLLNNKQRGSNKCRSLISTSQLPPCSGFRATGIFVILPSQKGFETVPTQSSEQSLSKVSSEAVVPRCSSKKCS